MRSLKKNAKSAHGIEKKEFTGATVFTGICSADEDDGPTAASKRRVEPALFEGASDRGGDDRRRGQSPIARMKPL